MSVPADTCLDDRPRRAALRDTDLNGLDYLEVDESDRHRLTVYFITKLGPLGDALTAANFAITGGRRVRDPKVTAVQVCEPADDEVDDCVTLTVDHIGDFSTYRLCVVLTDDKGHSTTTTHPLFDPVYACLDFSFQAGCPSPMDCREEAACPEPAGARPDIDYLAKDYASFRQVLLDRLALLIPGWNETHEPDLLVTLVELLAYEGDRLSYYQDAVATEAYLHTARQRISVRRHARLVDYLVHEGCNARAWVFVETSQDTAWMGYDDFFFVTTHPDAPPRGTPLSTEDLGRVPESSYLVFEPVPDPPAPRVPSAALCTRLLRGSDPVAAHLRRALDESVLGALATWDGEGEPPPELAARLLDDLDRVAHQQALHTAGAFDRYCRTGQPGEMLEKTLRGADLVSLNWKLLHCAFEEELAPPTGVRFYGNHNRITVYTWGERDCCLPRGTTAATLLDFCPPAPQPDDSDSGGGGGGGDDGPDDDSDHGGYGGSRGTERRPPAPGGYDEPTAPTPEQRGLHLAAGDRLLFEEVRDPRTGLPEDADPTHRHVVRLTRVTPTFDPVCRVPLLEVEWALEDALPFPLCLSARGPAPDCEWLEDVSVARGNVLLVDHGRRRSEELDAVEVDAIEEPCDDCVPEQLLVARRYRPTLTDPDLTFAQTVAAGAPATGTLVQDPHRALPQVRLQQVPMAPPRLELPDPLERYRNPLPLTAFDPEDLLPAAPVLVRLQKAGQANAAIGADPVATYLLGRLDQAARDALAAFVPPGDPPAALEAGLLTGLNAALDDDDLYDESRFPASMLDGPTKVLVADPTLPLDLGRLLRRWLLEQALPEALASTPHYLRDWSARFDLLASSSNDRHFVVEMTDDRRAPLRFGDDDLGQRPEPVSRFRAFYRAGSGRRGNVGAETITCFVQRRGELSGLTLTPRNPMPAVGGTEPETLDEVRLRAPHAIRRNMARAVIASDYATLAARDFASRLQGAAAELIWTGSWYEAHVTLDPWNREDAPPDLLESTRVDLGLYRRMGHALSVEGARYVPLVIVVDVCVKPGYQKAHVHAALKDAFASGRRADGRPGFFHPDNMRFRSSIDASEIVAEAQAVEGVVWSRVAKLERLGDGDAGEVDDGTLPVAAVEIPRVDSRNGFPELGSILFRLDGGR